jgi:hypothetical protein
MSLFVHPQTPNPPSPDKTVPPPARPGFSDGLGDRHLQADQTLGTTVEVLRFKKEFGDATPFEAALRQRVDDLRRLLHPSLPTLRGVDRLPDGHLALISDHVPGRRLSEILQTARGPVFAVELIRQLTPALATIQRPNPSFSHGLITADRIIVTREGRLVVVEHALGSAVESLKLPAARLRSQFGLAVTDSGGPIRLDQRMDVIQLGFVALTLLLGRRLDPGVFRTGIPALLDEFSQTSARDAATLRPWFERALQIAEHPFERAEDALDALEELPDNDDLTPKSPHRSILMFRSPAGETPGPRPVPAPTARPAPASDADQQSAVPAPAPAEARADTDQPQVENADENDDERSEETTEEMAANARSSRKMMWIAAGFALLSAAEAAVIASLVLYRPTGLPTGPAVTLQAAAPAAVDPAAVTEPARPDPTAPVTPTPPAPAPLASARPPEPDPAAATPPPVGGRIGGAQISAPVTLQVFQNGNLLGTTAGPIALAEGSHTLDLVNEDLAFRTRQTVAVKAGQLTAVRVTMPQGRININATPWANVWIDGNAAGETPIANLSLPIGNHEVVFRHPQLGEQRTTATVKAEGIARISVAFQR